MACTNDHRVNHFAHVIAVIPLMRLEPLPSCINDDRIATSSGWVNIWFYAMCAPGPVCPRSRPQTADVARTSRLGSFATGSRQQQVPAMSAMLRSGSKFRASSGSATGRCRVDGTAGRTVIRELARQQELHRAKFRRNEIAKRPDLLQPVSVSRAQLDRTVLQQDQAMPALRHPVRQTRGQLPGLRQARINPRIGCALMSSRPSSPNYSCFLSPPPLAGTVTVMGQRFR